MRRLEITADIWHVDVFFFGLYSSTRQNSYSPSRTFCGHVCVCVSMRARARMILEVQLSAFGRCWLCKCVHEWFAIIRRLRSDSQPPSARLWVCVFNLIMSRCTKRRLRFVAVRGKDAGKCFFFPFCSQSTWCAGSSIDVTEDRSLKEPKIQINLAKPKDNPNPKVSHFYFIISHSFWYFDIVYDSRSLCLWVKFPWRALRPYLFYKSTRLRATRSTHQVGLIGCMVLLRAHADEAVVVEEDSERVTGGDQDVDAQIELVAL